MKKQPNNTTEERKMKFAEAGILFVIVLAVTVFVGARLATHQATDDVTVAVQQEQPITEPVVATVPVEAAPESLTVSPVETTPALEAEPPRIVSYAMAEQAYFAGDYDQAVSDFETYTADHGENAWGYYMLGLSNWKAGDLDSAADAFVTALELKPDHLKSLINYSRVLLAQGQPIAARAQIELALQQAPEDVDANRMYSRICHNEGDLDGAVNSYLNVLQHHSDDVWSLNNLGLIRIEQGDFAAALAPLAKAAQLQPDVACIQNNLGIALERTGHITAATAAYEMALAADADYAKADESLARVAELSEDPEIGTIDLAELAAGFTAGPVTPAAVITEVPGDMDVATTLPQEIREQLPEQK